MWLLREAPDGAATSWNARCQTMSPDDMWRNNDCEANDAVEASANCRGGGLELGVYDPCAVPNAS